MKKLVLAIALILTGSIVFAADSPAPSVADIAKKEKERREKAKPTKTFTNEDVENFKAKHADETQTAPADTNAPVQQA